ncbi:hypothetical protein JL_217 [Bacillus phage JL]|uniref:Uncharacterized protein n=1 Tax=Bacillus phage JL TaxID=1296655 RepID=S5M4S5_9CAUD|nr:hypothetical protein AVV47_gp079 [Bacillus phage JL]AGR46881.1 hypothetical protein JL_217 [Bacillus phage JL]
MSNFFTITVDTTPPTIELIHPRQPIYGVNTEIIVKASEELAEYQGLYIEDSLGTRHTLIGTLEYDTIIYRTNFLGVALGTCRIYCTVKDVVDNMSEEFISVISLRTSALANKQELELGNQALTELETGVMPIVEMEVWVTPKITLEEGGW